MRHPVSPFSSKFTSTLPDRYKPITFLNTYWNLVKDYQPINSSTTSLTFSVTYQPLSLFKWQLYAAQAMKSRYVLTSTLFMKTL